MRIDGKLRKVRAKGRKCKGRLLSGAVKFTTSAAGDHATISRGRTVYATGASVSLGRGRFELLLDALRPLKPGRYTLTLRSRHARHRSTERVTITIG
jgi:hypothetical protein